MSKWWRHSLLELRLLFGNPLFISLPVLYAILFVSIMLKAAGSTSAADNLYSAAYSFHMLGHTMTLGPAMLIGILSIRRDIRRRSFEWNHSLPVSFLTLLSSKYAVSMFYFSLFTLSTSVIFYVISVSQGIDSVIALKNTVGFALQYEISYLVTLALAMLLGASIPNRIVYLIGFCAWMFGTFFMDIFIISGSSLYPMKVFHLNQFFLQTNTFMYENWSNELYHDEILRSRWFVIAFTILLLTVVLLLLNQTRPTRWKKSMWALLVGGSLLTSAAALPYFGLWAERYEQTAEKLKDPLVVTLDEGYKSPVEVFPIASYDIELERLKDDTLRIRTMLQASSEGLQHTGVLPLTLNRMFTLDEVRVATEKVDYRRQGDSITIVLPEGQHDMIEVELIYSGKVHEYSLQGAGLYAYSIRSEVRLEGYMAWYPLPGHQNVYLKDTAEMPSRIFTGGSNGLMAYSYGDMRLTVKGYDHPIYTGLEELERRPGYQQFAQSGMTQNLSLYGGENWIEVQKAGLPYRFVTTPYMKNATIGLAEDLQQKHDYFSSWLPSFRSGIDTILFLGQGNNLSRQHDQIVLSIQDRYNPPNLAGEWMNYILFGSQASLGYGYEYPERDVRGKISSLFWYLYYIEEKGLSDKQLKSAYMNLRSVQELLFKNGNGTDPQNKIGITMATKVRRALLEGKGDQVKQILTHFYQQGLMMPNTNSNPLRPLEEPISYSQWEQEWDRVMNGR